MDQINHMKAGLQLWTLREHTRTADEALTTLQQVKAMGYESIQVQPSRRGVSLTEYGDLARRTGLEICASHVSYDWILEDTAAVIEAHQAAGCPIIGIGEMPERFWGSAEGFLAFSQSLTAPAKLIREHGLQLVYHNHQFEFVRFNGKLGMDLLVESFDPAVAFELDTYWVQAGGADPMMWIRKLAHRLPIVHFKDVALNSALEQTFAPVGEGNLNWPGIIEACRYARTAWCVVEQDRCDRSAFDCVASSLSALRRLGFA